VAKKASDEYDRIWEGIAEVEARMDNCETNLADHTRKIKAIED
jgi:hypothetical protein